MCSVTSQFRVEDVFTIEGKGLVAAGLLDGVRHDFSIGARVRISRPDGTRLVCGVRGAEVLRTACFTESVSIYVLLGGVLTPQDVPRGSVVALETG
jgi:translation elongation factor EF-Tu-like GTPase